MSTLSEPTPFSRIKIRVGALVFCGEDVALIDSARQTALVVARQLDTMHARAAGAHGRLNCYVTDQGQRFERLATRFLGESVGQPVWVTPEMLELAEA